MSWVKAVACSELQHRPVVFQHPPKQIALFNVDGSVYAIDNRCPHEGYPLAEGQVDGGCTLTCNWHNWKFRLTDGRCILGGDNVRAYETRVDDGHVWVDLSDPAPEVMQAEILGGLREAFLKQEYDRICRELSRLHFYGLDPVAAVRRAVAWSHDRFEFGFVHAYAAAADWLTLAQQFPGQWEPQLICLAESIDHMAHTALRHPAYPFGDAGAAFTDQGFADAVEKENLAAAEGMVGRGLAEGLHWADMHEALATAALAHYNDFGHSLIYVYKAQQLIEHLGPETEPYLLLNAGSPPVLHDARGPAARFSRLRRGLDPPAVRRLGDRRRRRAAAVPGDDPAGPGVGGPQRPEAQPGGPLPGASGGAGAQLPLLRRALRHPVSPSRER